VGWEIDEKKWTVIYVICCSCCYTFHTEFPKCLPHLHFNETFVVSLKKRRSVKQECTDFTEIWGPPQSSLRQEVDLKHFYVRVTCIVRNFSIIKPTRCTNFTNLFWHETLHVSDSSSVLRARMELQFHPGRVRELSTNLYDNCWVYSE